MRRTIFSFASFALVISSTIQANAPSLQTPTFTQHIEALAGENGIGVRVAGSKEEAQAANYILKQWKDAGIDAELQAFEAVFRGETTAQASQNVLATIEGESSQVFIIGGHYDSVPASTESMGVIDNAASISLMIELAKYIKAQERLPITFKFIAFGAEERGLNGAQYYANQLSASERAKIIGMLNLDSIAGGDKLYIHSAHSAGYDCDGDKSRFTATSQWRDSFLALAAQKSLSFQQHPGNEEYPSGETGGWSDHAPFACVGIPIVTIEATNFELTGVSGKDGYSQTENANLWDCYDAKSKGSCDRENEKKWGSIWHTEFDRLDVLNKQFPGRLDYQLGQTYTLLTAFVDNTVETF